MTNNTDPSTNPSTLLTDTQMNVIAYNNVRDQYREKNSHLGSELLGEITAMGKSVLTHVKAFFKKD